MCFSISQLLVDIFVNKRKYINSNGINVYFTDLVHSFLFCKESMRIYLSNAIKCTLDAAPFLCCSDENLFLCFDILRYIHKDGQMELPIEVSLCS